MMRLAEVARRHRRALQTPTTEREQALITALRAIVAEAMDFPPVRPVSSDSYLPHELVDAAQAALSAYGARVALAWTEPVDDDEPADAAEPQTEREALNQAIGELVSGFGELR